jgi:cell division protein FtsW
VMKLLVILYVADYATRKQELMHQLKRGFIPMAAALAIVGILIMREPDLGALMVIVSVAMGVLFLGGMSPRLFFGMGAVLAAIFMAFILFVPFRRQRFFAYLEPFASGNAEGSGYQLTHSLMAIGKGEWFGVGLGGGVAKWNYLPEPHTDFLFAIIGEELGLVGMMCVIATFFWIVRRCFEIGRQAISFDLFFNGLVAQGVGLWIGIQAFINLGVNLGLLPTKGLTLPLMSFGGSAILMTCVALAIVLRIDFENRRLMRGTVL